ncbi:hypothetical protein [Streptomyces sp. NPDC048057]
MKVEICQVWDEARPPVLGAEGDAAVCGPDGCAVTVDHAAHTSDPHA